MRFLAITRPFFWPIGLTFFMGTRETVIYRLVSTNSGLGIICHFRFWALKRGVAPQVPLWVWGLKTRPKSWPTLWTFWVTCYLEIMFPIPPPPPLKLYYNIVGRFDQFNYVCDIVICSLCFGMFTAVKYYVMAYALIIITSISVLCIQAANL